MDWASLSWGWAWAEFGRNYNRTLDLCLLVEGWLFISNLTLTRPWWDVQNNTYWEERENNDIVNISAWNLSVRGPWAKLYKYWWYSMVLSAPIEPDLCLYRMSHKKRFICFQHLSEKMGLRVFLKKCLNKDGGGRMRRKFTGCFSVPIFPKAVLNYTK